MITRARWLGLVALLAGCKGYFKPPEPRRGLEFRQKASFFEASNGFRVFVLPDDSVDVVRLEVRYAVGAADDPPGKEGLAHLVEHLMFQTRIPSGEGRVAVVSELARVAQSYNAYTNLDATHYMTQGLAENLDALFTIEMSRLAAGCGTWDEATFLREREVVRNEIREGHARPEAEITRLLHETLYPSGHPYRRTVGGDDASLARITLADVCGFVGRYYVPGNATLFFVGRTDEAAVRRLAQSWLGRFPRRFPPAAPAIPPLPPGSRRVVTHQVAMEDPWVFVAFPLPPQGSRAARLAQMAVGELRWEVGSFAARYEWGYGVSVTEVGGSRAPALVVAIRLESPSQVDEAIEAVGKSLKWVHRSMASSGEQRDTSVRWLFRRESQKEDLIAAFASLEGRGSQFADYVQFDDQPLFLVGRLKELDQVGPQEVRRVVEEVLDEDRATVIVLRPGPGPWRYASAGVSFDPSGRDSDHWKVPVDLAEADRPVPLPASRRRPPPPERYRHDSGMEVLLWPHGTLPLAFATLLLDAGQVDEPKGQEGIARAAGPAALETTEFRTRYLASDVDRLIESIAGAVGVQGAGDFERWQELRKKELARERTRGELAFEHELRAALFGAGHPYAREAMTARSVEAIDHDNVMRFRSEHFRAAHGTLIVAGMFDPELVRKHIDYQFAQVPGGSPRRRKVPAAAPPSGPRFVSGKGEPGAPVVDLLVAFLGGHGVDKDQAARLVLERVLEARLRALREERALTYGASASFVAHRGPGEWRITTSIDRERVDEAVRLVMDLLADLRGDPNRYRGEFVIARRKLVEELLTQPSTTQSMLHRLAFIAAFDLDAAFFDRLVEEVAGLTLQDLQRVVQRELVPERMVFGAIGPPDAVARAVAAARGDGQR